MPKWEYLFVSQTWGRNRLLYPHVINDVEQKNWQQGPTMCQYLNQLGNEGWELAGIAGPPGQDNIFIFKRPK